MTIGFSTHWPKSMGPQYTGQPNHFVEKILRATYMNFGEEVNKHLVVGENHLGYSRKSDFINRILDSRPKLHTFRQDSSNRWKVGMKIHPVINNRTKNRFQFAPELEVKGIQKIEIRIAGAANVVTIDANTSNQKQYFYWGKDDYNPKLDDLAQNDGFETVEEFFAWFNKDFTGKIIHWTDLKY